MYRLTEDNAIYGKKGRELNGYLYDSMPEKHKSLFEKVEDDFPPKNEPEKAGQVRGPLREWVEKGYFPSYKSNQEDLELNF